MGTQMFIADKEFTWEMHIEFDDWVWDQCNLVLDQNEGVFDFDDLSLSLMGL